MEDWSEWRAFPNPNMGMFLYAPFGVGVYELKNFRTGELVLFGIGRNCAYRMSSLLPAPHGQGTRNNFRKREYVLDNIDVIEYRCLACRTYEEARLVEKQLKRASDYLFNT